MTNEEARDILINYVRPPIIRNDGKSMAALKALEAINVAVTALEALPSAERRGKWIDNGRWYVCSECGTEMPFTWFFKGVYGKSQRYCFNCGAKMEE